jgi:peptide/nickel transport system substrate-binding protein
VIRTVFTSLLLLALSAAVPTLAADPPKPAEMQTAEVPKHGGTLTYLIPADAPPSFDGHRETTFATLQSVAPFYSNLIKPNPENPSSTTDFVCDLCTEMPTPTDDGTTYTFKIRDGVKFHDGTPLTAEDVATSWQYIVDPPEGVTSAREGHFLMVDKVEAPDKNTVVFKLKFATTAFIPALADPFAFIYKKGVLEKNPHWYEKNIMGSGPFKFAGYETGQSIKGERYPDYYKKGLPYLDGFVAVYAPKQATRVDAIRADRAATEFRGLPPSAVNELKKELDDKITVQESDWNCVNLITANHQKKPFDDPRAPRTGLGSRSMERRAGAGQDRYGAHGGRHRLSGLAASKEELEKLPGYWPDIEKARAGAKRLLKDAGAEGLKFELLNRNIDQSYKYVAAWVIDEWRKIGLNATQKVLPTGPFYEALRNGNFDVTVDFNCQGVVNPPLDTAKYLPSSVYTENYGQYEDPKSIALYNKMLHEPEPTKQRALMRDFETYTLDTAAHEIVTPWWYRIIAHRSYMKGWKISPSHYINQNLETVWLDK